VSDETLTFDPAAPLLSVDLGLEEVDLLVVAP